MSHDPDPAAAGPAAAGVAQQAFTGLERDCLRRAVHDLRNRLNATSILLHVAMATAAKEGADGPMGKMTLAVRELQTFGRLLDQLVASSDSVASEIVPLDLATAVAHASRTSNASARGVTIHASPEHAPTLVLSCPTRLPRVLAVIFDRCIAALPDGGDVRSSIDGDAERCRLVVTASGPRVVAPPRADAFALADGQQPGSDWFAIRALARGLRGDARVTQENDAALRVELDLPRTDRLP
jgi:hypothetical protein